ncbi:MAG TPA: M14 family metallopeptidase [Thermoanaerobaculia bacterium]|nr:M14 family metallopeptidase [Thermoanaerobaculia bacterium]
MALLLALIAPVAAAQSRIAPPSEFLGYSLGTRFTPYHRILDYFESLQKSSPLVSVERFGSTYEGRPLVYVLITSAKNRSALDDIRGKIAAISRPDRTPREEARNIAESTPAVVWLGFGIHGDEASSSEAAMQVAYTLVSDKSAESILDRCVVLIDPLQNPDGRELYIEAVAHTMGMHPNSNPEAMEHESPWKRGRLNHYGIDMNRDWSWLTQKETVHRVALYQQWNPQVFVDFHEMNNFEVDYFFPPDAEPINSNVDPDTMKWFEVFGRANAAAFSTRNWSFFVGEKYDLFYPGYGDSWPTLHGAIGMTYEVAGGRHSALAYKREDNTELTLTDRVNRHYTSAMTTLLTAADHKSELILHTYDTLRRAWDAPLTTFIFEKDSPNLLPALKMLQRQGIIVSELASAATVRATSLDGRSATASHTFPAGTPAISTRQPLGALARGLIERTPALSKEFVAAQRQKIDSDEPDDFYDVTAWSVPVSSNLSAFAAEGTNVDLRAWAPPPATPYAAGKIGYLIDGSDPQIYHAEGRLMRAGINFSVSGAEISSENRNLARGTVVIRRSNNPSTLDEVLRGVVTETGVTPIGIDSVWSKGMALGSSRVHYIRDPRIAVIGGEGVDPNSFGGIWFALDVETEVPHSLLSLDKLASADLSKYRVLVFPDGDGYADAISKKTSERLETWLQGGGTIIAIKGAGEFLRGKDVHLSKVKTWTAPRTDAAKADKSAKDEKSDKSDSENEEETRYNDFRIPGAAFRTVMNTHSFLTFGVPRSPSVILEGKLTLKVLLRQVDNVMTVEDKDPLISGFAWPESLKRARGAGYLLVETVGKGSIITFADEPYFRGFWRGTMPLLMNAVLYSPSFSNDPGE